MHFINKKGGLFVKYFDLPLSSDYKLVKNNIRQIRVEFIGNQAKVTVDPRFFDYQKDHRFAVKHDELVTEYSWTFFVGGQ